MASANQETCDCLQDNIRILELKLAALRKEILMERERNLNYIERIIVLECKAEKLQATNAYLAGSLARALEEKPAPCSTP